MTGYAVVVDDCEAPNRLGILSIRTHDTVFGPKNFSLRLDDAVAGLPRQLTELEMDWIEVLGMLFAVDMACERGAGDIEWNRSIEAWLPVRDPDRWELHRRALEKVWVDLTGDELDLHFVLNDGPQPPPRMARTPFHEHAGVALFSGGQDSFAGALDLLDDGARPLLLSHTASGATNTAQTNLEAVLKSLDTDVQRVRMGAGKAQGAIFPGSESSQRGRTLFFTGIAALLAHVGGSERVWLNENGIMAIHVPLTAARAGSLSTHTASPPIVEAMQVLANAFLGSSVLMENRLVNLTKPEVVKRAVDLGQGAEMQNTVSCWQIGRTRTHCGYCAPCIMRRISCETHGVNDAPYEVDIFEDLASLGDTRTRDNLTHFISLIEDLSELDDVELEYEYPELLGGSPALSLAETLSLHRRWSAEASAILFAHSVPMSLR